jgi:hypothetical protein
VALGQVLQLSHPIPRQLFVEEWMHVASSLASGNFSNWL